MKRNILLLLMCLFFSGIEAQNYKDFFEKATRCEQADSLEQAEKYYKEALKAEPTNAHNAMIFANLGRLQYRQHRLEEAMQSYDLAINLVPLSVPVLMDRASLALEMSDVNKAFVDCSTVLDVNKNNVKALLLRAYLRCGKREYKEAHEDYNLLLELEPQSISGRMGLALLYQEEQKYKEALKVLNKLIVETPDDAELYIIRAGVEKEISQLDFALMDMDRAISLSPQYANAYLLRGEILKKQNKKGMAKHDFEKAIELGIPRSELMEQLKECK